MRSSRSELTGSPALFLHHLRWLASAPSGCRQTSPWLIHSEAPATWQMIRHQSPVCCWALLDQVTLQRVRKQLRRQKRMESAIEPELMEKLMMLPLDERIREADAPGALPAIGTGRLEGRFLRGAAGGGCQVCPAVHCWQLVGTQQHDLWARTSSNQGEMPPHLLGARLGAMAVKECLLRSRQ